MQQAPSFQIKLSQDDLLPVREVARLLHVHRVTVYRWITQRRVTTVTIGNTTFVPKTEVERLRELANPNVPTQHTANREEV